MPRAQWEDGAATARHRAEKGLTLGQGRSWLYALLLFGGRLNSCLCAGLPGGCLHPLQRSPRGILFGVFLGAAHAASQLLPRLTLGCLEPNFDQKALMVVGAAFALDPINRRSGA